MRFKAEKKKFGNIRNFGTSNTMNSNKFLFAKLFLEISFISLFVPSVYLLDYKIRKIGLECPII